MKKIVIPPSECYDSKKNLFIPIKGWTFTVEHSLVSISKWESKWHKPFLSKEPKSYEESIDYVRCMTITQNVDPEAYKYIDNRVMNEINAYIDDPMTATTFSNRSNPPTREIITSEVIYYWMIELGIPVEFQKWHLNRLLTLIRVIELKRTPSKKMSRSELAARNRSLNAARRQAMGTRG